MPIDVNCSAWKGFRTGEWRHLVNVRNFIQKNYTPYAGDESFLAPTSERTQKVWDKSQGDLRCGNRCHLRHQQLRPRLY